MNKAIIFDLDGTLLDTIDDLTDTVNYILKSYHLPTHSKDAILSFVGNGARRLIDLSLPLSHKHLLDEILNKYMVYYDSHSMIKTKPYKDIMEVLLTLKRHYKLGVISNKQDKAVVPMVNHYFDGIFDFITGEKPGIPKKPDPTSLLKMIHDMNVDPSKVIYVGDSEVDYQTAKHANVTCVLVSWGFRDKKSLEKLHPTYLIDSPNELLKIVEV